MRVPRLLLVLAAIIPALGASGRASSIPSTSPATDSADVIAVVQAFGRALESGDSATALAMLAPDAIVLEAGGLESREEYRGHHLPADIKFHQSATTTVLSSHATVMGDAAWVSSTSRSEYTSNAQPVTSLGAELMVLSRTAHASRTWTIRAIHWSARRATR
jgi:ketosteroid isomerase-like protein